MKLSVHLGTVVGSKSVSNDNTLIIQPLDPDVAAECGDQIEANYGSPFGGTGYGFVATPANGATVLYVDLKGEKIRYDYVWFACVFDPTAKQQQVSQSEYNRPRPEDFLRNAAQGKLPSQDDNPNLGGVPENSQLFGTDGYNKSVLLKSQGGHRFKMSDNVSEVNNRLDDGIELQTRGGKTLRLDDEYDNIKLYDDSLSVDNDPNRIIIQAQGEVAEEGTVYTDKTQIYQKRDFESISREGSVNNTILDGKGTLYRENLGEGDIHDIIVGRGKDNKGNYLLDANHDVSSFSRKGDILQRCEEGNTTQYTKLDHDITVDANANTTIADDYNLAIGGNWSTTVEDDTTLSVGGMIQVTTSMFLDVTSSLDTRMTAGTGMYFTAGADIGMTAGGGMSITTGGSLVITAGGGILMIAPRVDII